MLFRISCRVRMSSRARLGSPRELVGKGPGRQRARLAWAPCPPPGAWRLAYEDSDPPPPFPRPRLEPFPLRGEAYDVCLSVLSFYWALSGVTRLRWMGFILPHMPFQWGKKRRGLVRCLGNY
uniref:Uncharacterized protein n=1 Tax=Kalanchoe fedtschenkoi TaxID=63787 RepID=A0A7N0RHQ2_KALFE